MSYFSPFSLHQANLLYSCGMWRMETCICPKRLRTESGGFMKMLTILLPKEVGLWRSHSPHTTNVSVFWEPSCKGFHFSRPWFLLGCQRLEGFWAQDFGHWIAGAGTLTWPWLQSPSMKGKPSMSLIQISVCGNFWVLGEAWARWIAAQQQTNRCNNASISAPKV